MDTGPSRYVRKIGLDIKCEGGERKKYISEVIKIYHDSSLFHDLSWNKITVVLISYLIYC